MPLADGQAHWHRAPVMLDSAATTDTFFEVRRREVQADPAKAPAKVGPPRTTIVELVESHYDLGGVP